MTKTEALAMMMECFPASQVTAAMNATFLEACNRAPLEAVVKCCADFRHGKVERKRNEFIPSTAQFSKHLRTVENEQRFDRKRASNQRRIEAPKQSVEDRARMAEKMAFLAEHGPDAAAKKYGINQRN